MKAEHPRQTFSESRVGLIGITSGEPEIAEVLDKGFGGAFGIISETLEEAARFGLGFQIGADVIGSEGDVGVPVRGDEEPSPMDLFRAEVAGGFCGYSQRAAEAVEFGRLGIETAGGNKRKRCKE